MTLQWLVLAISVLLAGCVATPLGPQVPFDYTHLGVPVFPSETVAIFVSMEPYPRDPGGQKGQASPIASPARALEGITTGFRALPSDVQIAAAGESLGSACFGVDTPIADDIGPRRLLPAADLSRRECRALLDERGVRYLVAVAGYQWTGRQVLWGTATALGSETAQGYLLTAQVVDTTNGTVVCEASDHQVSVSTVGAALFYIPIPVLSVGDESAYWKRLAWNLGNKLRSCFLQP